MKSSERGCDVAMFNEERKLKFIEENNLYRQNRSNFVYLMTKWFSKTAFDEELKGKDLCNYTSKELLELYKSLFIGSYDMLVVVHSYFNIYAAWCLERGEVDDGINHFAEISLKKLGECIDNTVAHDKVVTRENLLKFIDSSLNPDDAALLLGLFEGLTFEDFDYLEAKHVKGNEVNIPKGRKLRVSDELARYLVESANEYTKHGSNGREINLDIDDPRVIKNLKLRRLGEEPDRFMKYRNMIRTIKNNCPEHYEWISAAGLPQSGAVDILKRYMDEEGKPLEVVAKEHLNDIRERYGSGWRFDGRFMTKFGHCFK